MSKLPGVLIVLLSVLLLMTVIIMWGWSLFAVPVFGLKPLTLSQAFGFTLLANTFKSVTNSSSKK